MTTSWSSVVDCVVQCAAAALGARCRSGRDRVLARTSPRSLPGDHGPLDEQLPAPDAPRLLALERPGQALKRAPGRAHRGSWRTRRPRAARRTRARRRSPGRGWSRRPPVPRCRGRAIRSAASFSPPSPARPWWGVPAHSCPSSIRSPAPQVRVSVRAALHPGSHGWSRICLAPRGCCSVEGEVERLGDGRHKRPRTR